MNVSLSLCIRLQISSNSKSETDMRSFNLVYVKDTNHCSLSFWRSVQLSFQMPDRCVVGSNFGFLSLLYRCYGAKLFLHWLHLYTCETYLGTKQPLNENIKTKLSECPSWNRLVSQVVVWFRQDESHYLDKWQASLVATMVMWTNRRLLYLCLLHGP